MRDRAENIQADPVTAHCSGGLWTQSKMLLARVEVDPARLRCQQAPGTIGHRLHVCDGLAAWRRNQGFGELRSIYHGAGNCPLV
eukprot:6456501-Pyramimonas_sp.AAC.1